MGGICAGIACGCRCIRGEAGVGEIFDDGAGAKDEADTRRPLKQPIKSPCTCVKCTGVQCLGGRAACRVPKSRYLGTSQLPAASKVAFAASSLSLYDARQITPPAPKHTWLEGPLCLFPCRPRLEAVLWGGLAWLRRCRAGCHQEQFDL